MGTSLELRVTASDRTSALAASEAAAREVERVEALLSTWRPGTPLTRVNEGPVGVPIGVPREVASLLADMLALADRTGGAFDPTVAPLVRAWGLREGGRVPSPAEIAAAREALGAVRVDRAAATVTRLHSGAGLDEGAWGKGYALDRAASILRGLGASGVLDLGGQLLALGEAEAGVAHPRQRDRVVLTLRLRDGSVSTSGNSERAVGEGSSRIGHLLDPRTGRPARDFGSVTVLAPTGLVADVLSTALFVVGPDEGLRVSESLRASGLAHEALYLIDRGNHLEARPSAGFLQQLISADGSITGLPRISAEGGHAP